MKVRVLDSDPFVKLYEMIRTHKALTIKAKYKLKDVTKQIGEAVKNYRELQQEILEEIGAKDEEGNLIMQELKDEEGNVVGRQVQVQEGKEEYVAKKSEELESLEADLPVLTVSFIGEEVFKDLSSADLEILDGFIVLDPEPEEA